MAENSFRIPLTLFFVTLMMMFDHCKATPVTSGGNVPSSMEPPQQTKAPTRPKDMENCKKYLPKFEMRCNRSCACGNSEMPMPICYPAVLSEEGDPIQKIKPSRRFTISASKPEKLDACPTGEGAVKYRNEFSRMSHPFLDDYHQLFLSMTAYALECGKMKATTAITDADETNATTKPLETTKTTTQTTTTTTTITTTTAPSVEVPYSEKLNIALQDGCTIAISAELLNKGNFEVLLLFNYPEQISGMAEEMFKFSVTNEKIKMISRFSEEKEMNRTDLFHNKTFDLKINVFDSKYVVQIGDKELANVTNRDPLWAINYTYVIGDLKLIGRNPIKVKCDKMKPVRNASAIDLLIKLDNKKPTELELRDVLFKDPSSPSRIKAYLLTGCPKFNMNVCMVAMEYHFKSFQRMGASFFYIDVTMHRRQPQPGKEYELHIIARQNKTNHEYMNALNVDVFDHKKELLATYIPSKGPPFYTIEYFRLQAGNLTLMEEPKFCKKDDEEC